MKRRTFLKQAGVMGAAAVAGRARAQSTPRRPNLVYVFSDEHRWQSMAHTEMPHVQTPNMTRLGEEGVEFSHCISNYPVCSPYRAILQTGRWPYQQGVIDNKIVLDPNQPTLGRCFKDAGYKTGYIGKWHLGGNRAEPYGYDHSLVWSKDGNHRKADYHPADAETVTMEGYTVDNKTDQAIDFIDRNQDDPFCLLLSYNAPHARFDDAPDDLNALYPPDTIPQRPNWEESKYGKRFEYSEKNYHGYHAHITGVDRALGRIMDALEERGIAEDTILVYTSDHGTMMGAHGVGSKRQPYEESIRVPFMARWPKGIREGLAVDPLFGTIDIMPTMLSLAGVEVPEVCVGQDFSPWFLGERGPDPDNQFIMHIQKLNASHGNDHPAPIFRGVRTKRHTYAVIDNGERWLFDNPEDPYQMANLADDPAHAATRAAYEKLTSDWLKQANDPFVL